MNKIKLNGKCEKTDRNMIFNNLQCLSAHALNARSHSNTKRPVHTRFVGSRTIYYAIN